MLKRHGVMEENREIFVRASFYAGDLPVWTTRAVDKVLSEIEDE
jgi:hypothetical protein